MPHATKLKHGCGPGCVGSGGRPPPKTCFISARLSLLNFFINKKLVINSSCRNHAPAIQADLYEAHASYAGGLA